VHTLDLEDQDLTADSCAYYPVSGIEYIEHKDALVVSLFDGSFHVISNLSANPQLVASNTSESLTTEGLSLQARTAFTRVETREARLSTAITRYDANRISGMTSYDHGGTFAWIHEYVPYLNSAIYLRSSFGPDPYGRPISVTSTTQSILAFSLFRRCGPISKPIAGSRACAIAQLVMIVSFPYEPSGPNAAHVSADLGHSTMSVLRPIFCALRNGARTAQFAVEVVEALKGSQHACELPEIAPPIADPNGDGVCRRAYRTSLTSHLFGWPHVTALRRRVALAALMQVCASSMSPHA
jgi:general transcription factor 3C protein 4